MQIEKNKFYGIQELAGKENTGLSYGCIRNMCINGKLKHIKAGTKYLISGNAILKLIDSDSDDLAEQKDGNE